jgi:hypothetical protein
VSAAIPIRSFAAKEHKAAEPQPNPGGVATKRHKKIARGCGWSLPRAYRRNGDVAEAEKFFVPFRGQTGLGIRRRREDFGVQQCREQENTPILAFYAFSRG